MSEDRDIVVRQRVSASLETCFRAWTSAEHVERWWSPTPTARCTLCEIDLRVGGRYRIHMSDPANDLHCEVEGVFREVAPPRRIVYTWNASTNDGEVENTLVTVEFHARTDAETEVVVRHTGLPHAPIRDGHRDGWEKMLASYASYLASVE